MNIKKMSLLVFLSMVLPGAMIYSAAGEEKEADRSGEDRKRKNDDENSSRKKETSSRDDVIDSLRKISSLRQGFDLIGLSYDNFLDGQYVFILEVDKDHNNDEMSVEMMLFDAMNSVTEKAESIIVEKMSLLLKKSFNDAIDSQTNLDDLGMRLYSYAIGRKFSFGKFILQAIDMPNIFLRSAFYNNIQIVKLMIEAGIDVNVCDVNSFTALMLAAQHGRAEVVRILIDAGVDLNIKQFITRGDTALIFAINKQHGNIIDMLIRAGANTKGEALLDAVITNNIKIVIMLINFGGDVNYYDHYYATSLRLAAVRGNLEIVQALINAGADINNRDGSGIAILSDACEEGHIEIVQTLINAGADINQPNNFNYSPLMTAIFNRRPTIAQMLIEHGANLDLQSNQNEENEDEEYYNDTALMLAVEKKYPDLVRQLILAGANTDLVNSNGRTAFDLANEEMRQVIQDAIAQRLIAAVNGI